MDWPYTGHIKLAKDQNGAVIGVTLRLLVLPDQVPTLPQPWRDLAQNILYEHEAMK